MVTNSIVNSESPTYCVGGFGSEPVYVRMADNTYEVRYLSPLELSAVRPIANIETDLQALLDAGVNPQYVAVDNILSPTSRNVLEQRATDTLCRLADGVYDASKKADTSSSPSAPVSSE